MSYIYRKAAVGGTFDVLHKGHQELIKTAFNIADNVLIGVTSDEFASVKDHEVEPCDVRIAGVEDYIRIFDNNYEIKKIDDAAGSADYDPDLDVIVVSKETEKSAVHINNIRHKNGLDLLDIVVVEWVLADDNIPISSTRIRKGEVTQEGLVLSE